MNRSEHAWGSTVVVWVAVGLFCLLPYFDFDSERIRYNGVGLPSWEAQVVRAQEHNDFWTHAAERSVVAGEALKFGYPESWMDYDFAWDVYTVHANSAPEAEALYAARSRLLGLVDRPYESARYIELGFAAQGSLTDDDLVLSSEFVRQVQRLHTAGLESMLTQAPPKPEAPVYFPATVWNWVTVFPRWLVLWVGLSWVFYFIHATTRKQDPLKGFSLYDEIVSVPGAPISRAILFAQTFWAIAFFAGLGALARTARASARGINTASDRLREMRHPNRAEIRRARRAIKTLKREDAAPWLITKAETVLREWSVIPADEAPMHREKPSRSEDRLAAAVAEVEKLHQELEADREATAAVRPPRERAKQ